jgi:hypothetical protein
MTIKHKAKHSIPITILPNGIKLSRREVAELCLLEDLYYTRDLTENELNLAFDFKETSNIGLHHFCINNSCELRFLASNPTISVEVAYAIFEALYASENHYSVIRKNICISLLCSTVVLNDIKLFELIFNKTFVGSFKKIFYLSFIIKLVMLL